MQNPAKYILSLLLVCFSLHAMAQGGPPLITDDPGTPGDGHWEVNLALATWAGNSQAGLLSAPYADINYGWGEHVQLKFETGLAYLRDGDSYGSRGFTPGIAGVKYRFLDEDKDGFAMSTYPQIQFPMQAGTDPDLLSPDTAVILPLEFQKTYDPVGIDIDVGYVRSSLKDSDQLFYGWALGYTIAKEKELLCEMHFTNALTSHETEVLYNVGTRWGIAKGVSFMASVGHTLQNFSGDQPREMFWLGVQLTN